MKIINKIILNNKEKTEIAHQLRFNDKNATNKSKSLAPQNLISIKMYYRTVKLHQANPTIISRFSQNLQLMRSFHILFP